MHIEIRLGTEFQFKLSIFVFWIKLAQKNVFLVKNTKRECSNLILHLSVSLDTKLQHKLTFLIF